MGTDCSAPPLPGGVNSEASLSLTLLELLVQLRAGLGNAGDISCWQLCSSSVVIPVLGENSAALLLSCKAVKSIQALQEDILGEEEL